MNERLKQLLVDASKPENRMNFVTYGKLTNEKLIEFAIQSGLHPSYLDPENPENSLIGLLNKFAELIVKECVKEIEFQYGGGSDQPMDNEWDRAIECVSSMVKYRFGVSE